MQFRTELLPDTTLQGIITHSTPIWTVGSCFADNIGDRMLADGFDIEVNPLGTLYNPLSILNSISNLVKGKVYTPEDLFLHEGKYRTYDFHSIFSRSTPEAATGFINTRMNELRGKFSTLSTLILTFGSARCFKLKSTGQAVANCHKQHPNLFQVEDLSTDTCIEAISETISLMQRVCPTLSNVILTVSPIRHKAYGFHADKLSKATLLLATRQVCLSDPDLIHYFPSYEIMMDDLRDYRFYASDMIHPSETAVDYIYEKFSQTCYTPATREKAAARLKAFRRSLHRPDFPIKDNTNFINNR